MTTITFDTHKFIRKLKTAGFDEAEAVADAFSEAQGEAELATKADITSLRRDIDDVRRDMREMEQRMIIKMGSMMVVAIAVIAALVKLL